MALSLKAEEKLINNVFGGKNQYVIPPYQRPYSWTEEQCRELFEDLKNALEDKDNKDNGYFLGNIVIASSKEDKNRLEVIDGQQRLTTLTLLMKALLIFDDNNQQLENAIWELHDRTRERQEQRLKTTVFEDRDSQFLKEALELNLNSDDCQVNKKDNQFKKNICYFYGELSKLNEKKIQNFVDFLLYDVSLLPIQTEGSNQEIARENALKIFETINDRGLPLSDSDIFKAKLFSMALNEKKSDKFIKEWKELDEQCNEINFSIDEVFKIYTHIIRGGEGETGVEVKLRDFFTRKSYSPFNSKKYEQILEDIFKIIDSIKFFQNVIKKPKEYKEITKWFQLIERYSNKLPLYTLFVYLYVNKLEESTQLINFSKNLVKYSYFEGSTSKIKFRIFELISKLMKEEENFINYLLNFIGKVKSDSFEYSTKLKNAYALLTFYLQENQKAIYPYYFDKIINTRDESNLNDTWKNRDFSDYTDTLGNILVIDFTKKNTLLEKKINYLKNSDIVEIKNLSNDLENWSYEKYKNREEILQKRLISFFEKIDEN